MEDRKESKIIIYLNPGPECPQRDSGKTSFYVSLADRRLGSKQVLWSPQGLKVGWEEKYIRTICYRVGDKTREGRKESGECLPESQTVVATGGSKVENLGLFFIWRILHLKWGWID